MAPMLAKLSMRNMELGEECKRCAQRQKPHVLAESRLVRGFGGVLRLHAGPLTHRTAGRIDALITSLSLNQGTKKTTPMVAARRKADIIMAHHIVRVRSFSESFRSIVSLHQLCQALISILAHN
jgi:hypothetical protein